MNDYYNEETFPEYINLLKSQEVVPGQNFEPVLFKDILDQSDLDYIRKQFNNISSENIKVQGYAGLGTLPIELSENNNSKNIIKKIESLASNAVGEELEVFEYGGTRYSPLFGWYPKFGPHYDARPVEVYVFDYHVQSTQDWGLFVEGKKFNFGDNEALLFPGTGRIHWREPIKLEDDAKIDLIFFWMQHKKPKPLSNNHTKIMKERAYAISNKITPPPNLKTADWWKTIKISNATEQYPNFKKISNDTENPITHNEIYHSTINENFIKTFYENNETEQSKIVMIEDDLIDKIKNIMLHIHSAHKIKFENVYFIKHEKKENKLDLSSINKLNKIILSFVVPLTFQKTTYRVSGNALSLENGNGVTMSTTNQDCIFVSSTTNNNICDSLMFNFSIESRLQ